MHERPPHHPDAQPNPGDQRDPASQRPSYPVSPKRKGATGRPGLFFLSIHIQNSKLSGVNRTFSKEYIARDFISLVGIGVFLPLDKILERITARVILPGQVMKIARKMRVADFYAVLRDFSHRRGP